MAALHLDYFLDCNEGDSCCFRRKRQVQCRILHLNTCTQFLINFYFIYSNIQLRKVFIADWKAFEPKAPRRSYPIPTLYLQEKRVAFDQIRITEVGDRFEEDDRLWQICRPGQLPRGAYNHLRDYVVFPNCRRCLLPSWSQRLLTMAPALHGADGGGARDGSPLLGLDHDRRSAKPLV